MLARKGFSIMRLLALVAAFAMVLAGCGGGAKPAPAPAAQPQAPKLKIAMILPGVVEDADYNFVGYQALEELKKAYGAEVKHQEKVAPADAERVARGFINDGYNVVAFHGGQFVTTVKKLAPQSPDVTFIMESSGPMSDLPSNVWNIGRKFYEGFYSLGTLGGLATKSGKVGIIAGIKLPDFVASINAIQVAAKAANPKVQVIHTFVGDQNDPVKARQAAEAMINDGVDFIIMIVNLGASGVIEAAKGKPVLVTTYYTDKTSMGPKNMAGSLLVDFAVPYKNVVGKIAKGERTGYEEQRPGNGMSLSKLTNVSADVAKKVQSDFDKVVKKEIKIIENAKEIEPMK